MPTPGTTVLREWAEICTKIANRSWPDGYAAFFAGSDANAVIHREDEDFAVANLARIGGFADGLDGGSHKLLVHGNFQFYFLNQANRYLSAPELLGVTSLRSAAVNVGDGLEMN